LWFVPQDFQQNIAAGVTKSAMNSFAGICSAVMNTVQDPQFVHGEDSYFEEINVIGNNRSIEQVLKNEYIPKFDLYIGEFNHKINNHKGYNHYKPGDVMGDVEKLLNEKFNGRLTVAIDSTIDLVNSPKAKALFEKFHDEIKNGKLNVIVFRS